MNNRYIKVKLLSLGDVHMQRLSHKNPISARNYAPKQADARAAELVKARQVHQQNSLLVNGVKIIYYQQAKTGFTCTCHAQPPPTQTELDTQNIQVESGAVNVTHQFKVTLNTPLFGQSVYNAGALDEDPTSVFDDSEGEATTPLFPDLFAKGTDCGMCYRTGWLPLWQPVGRNRQVLGTHNVVDFEGYTVDRTQRPNVFHENRILKSHVHFKLLVPAAYRGCFFGVFNNNRRLMTHRVLDVDGIPILDEQLRAAAGTHIDIYITGGSFTHVVFEFDLGVSVSANFPQLSVSRDYNYFFNLQSVSIELPPTVCNAQVADIVIVPEWRRMWTVFNINPWYDHGVLIRTTVEARVINTIETMAIMAKLSEMTDRELMPLRDEFVPIINKIW
jgi:hypothetical protein